MKNRNKSGCNTLGSLFFRIIKSAIVAEVLTVVLLLLYAWLLWQGILKQDSIPIVTSALKVICSALAALMVVARHNGYRWLTGAISGIGYILLSFVVFSILSDHFSFSLGSVSDVLMGGLAGMLTGMFVQIRK